MLIHQVVHISIVTLQAACHPDYCLVELRISLTGDALAMTCSRVENLLIILGGLVVIKEDVIAY